MNAKAKSLAAALAGETADQVRQREFIEVFYDNMKEEMLKKVPQMPPAWDGHEMRLLAYERMRHGVSSLMRDARSKRVREFVAHCLTYNLY